jgi:MFS transporter, ACS family, hexuronate transporter
VSASVSGIAGQVSRYRWRICGLLFFITTLNYVDRQVFSVLAPELQRVIGWNELQYGNIVTAFQAAYAIGLLTAGRFIDRIGTRIGYAIAIIAWSLSTGSHALVATALGFGIVRFFLGLSESANFPAAVKTVAEWFPKRERAFATGIFNSGANIGAIVAPLAAPWIAIHMGWQWVFLFMGALSALWVLPWLLMYRRPEEHPAVSPAELSLIQSDAAESVVQIPWTRLLRHKETWAFVAGKFFTDPIWTFFLFWLPKFLSQFGLKLTALSWPLAIIYTLSTVGSIGGGWLPSKLLKLGWDLNRARKTAMLVCAVTVIPIVLAPLTSKLWVVIALSGLAMAAHQGWSANLYTSISDVFPKRAVGSVVGIAGFGGAVANMLMATFTGFMLQYTHSYVPMFILSGVAYLIALAVIHVLVPKLKPLELD